MSDPRAARTTLIIATSVVAACAASGGLVEPAGVAIATAPLDAVSASAPVASASASAAATASASASASGEPARPPSFAEALPDGHWVLQPRGWVMSATAHLPLGHADGDAKGVRCGEGTCKSRELCCNASLDPFCVFAPGKLYGPKGVGEASVACAAAVDAENRGNVANARGCDDSSECARGERCCSIVLAANANYFCNDARGRQDCWGPEPCARGASCPAREPVCDEGLCRASRPSDRRGISCGKDTCKEGSPLCCASEGDGRRHCGAKGACEGERALACTAQNDCPAGEFCAWDMMGGTSCSNGVIWGGGFLNALCSVDTDCASWARRKGAWLRTIPGGKDVKPGRHRCEAGKPFGVCAIDGLD